MPYKKVLKNEIDVTWEGINKIFNEKEVLVLGYGSLLYGSGWLGRGMSTPPKSKDLIECQVDGYERGHFGLVFPFGRHVKTTIGTHYYGVIPNSKTCMNGVLAPVKDIEDWVALMSTEMLAGIARNYNYRGVDITDSVRGVKLKDNQVVHMVVNEPGNKAICDNFTAAAGYYERVARGVELERSEDFKDMFYQTGGLTLDKANELAAEDELSYIRRTIYNY